jgi:predicted glycosyltransferase involved in capsule biosynthesis
MTAHRKGEVNCVYHLLYNLRRRDHFFITSYTNNQVLSEHAELIIAQKINGNNIKKQPVINQ